MRASALISVEELYRLSQSDELKVVDASYGLPPFSHKILGAVDFDIDEIADHTAHLPHTVPSAAEFAAKVGALGISNQDTVVVYDRAGIYMAASRVWWMFRLFGHDKVYVLNGGLSAWVNAGYTLLAPNTPPSVAQDFTAQFRPSLYKDKEAMKINIDQKSFVVVDARDPARYAGSVAEPRSGVDVGHIPGALNIPFQSLIEPSSGQLKDKVDLESRLSCLQEQSVAVSCGSGVTAAVIALACHEIGMTEVAIYGGSWAEWGIDQELPKTQGQRP